MKQFFCKYCSRPMSVSFLEYRSNSYCNLCFDDRAGGKPIGKETDNSFVFMGEVFVLSDSKEIKNLAPINPNLPSKIKKK